MKVEAPERIYVCDNVFPNHVDREGSPINTKRIDDHDIEYIKMDAFIEKACEWLKESVTNNPECNRIISKKGVITMGELIEDFIKYVKGE